MAVVIKDLLPAPMRVAVGTGYLDVRGLSIRNVSSLLSTYKNELSQFFVNDAFDAPLLLTTAPELAVDIIAMAADAVGQEDDILRIPAAAQIELLLAIWKQSVPDVKKLRESLLEVVSTLNPSSVEAKKRSPLPTISENSLPNAPST